MKKLTTLVTAILLAGTAGAIAKPTVISLNGNCDVLTIAKDKPLKTALLATDDPDCVSLHGAGFIGRIQKIGNSAIIGMQGPAFAGRQFVFRIDYPFVTGGSWVLYSSDDGVHLSALAGDTYTVESGAVHKAGLKPAISAAH